MVAKDTPSTSVRWAARVAPLVGAVAVLAAVVWRVGGGPFVDGLDAVTAPSLAAAAALGAVATVGCAWRWALVAQNLGLQLPLRAAVPAYYRSQFLNSTLPAGVLGDVHRAASHGREVGDLGRSLRAVAWERTAGQVVQLGLGLVVLAVCPSPVRSSYLLVAPAAGGVAALVLLVSHGRPARRPSRIGRTVQAARDDARHALLVRRSWPGIVAASVVVVIAHLGTFLIAARAAGSAAPPVRLLPLGVLVLLAMALPLSVGGWGAGRRCGAAVRSRRPRGRPGGGRHHDVRGPRPRRDAARRGGPRRVRASRGRPAFPRCLACRPLHRCAKPGRRRPWLTAPTRC